MQEIAAENAGKKKMFYCGPPVLAKTLRQKCAAYNVEFHEEVF